MLGYVGPHTDPRVTFKAIPAGINTMPSCRKGLFKPQPKFISSNNSLEMQAIIFNIILLEMRAIMLTQNGEMDTRAVRG